MVATDDKRDPVLILQTLVGSRNSRDINNALAASGAELSSELEGLLSGFKEDLAQATQYIQEQSERRKISDLEAEIENLRREKEEDERKLAVGEDSLKQQQESQEADNTHGSLQLEGGFEGDEIRLLIQEKREVIREIQRIQNRLSWLYVTSGVVVVIFSVFVFVIGRAAYLDFVQGQLTISTVADIGSLLQLLVLVAPMYPLYNAIRSRRVLLRELRTDLETLRGQLDRLNA